MSSTMVVCGRRACTRSIHAPDRSASAARLASLVSHPVSKRPIWLVEAARRSRPVAIHHSAHRRIMGETFSVVHILIAGEAAEHRLAQQAGQQVTGVLATAAFRQRRASQIGQPERIIQFAVGQQSGVGGDPAAVEFQLQAAVEIDPQRRRHPIHPLGVPSTRALVDDNTLIFMPDSALLYKEIRTHPGNPG